MKTLITLFLILCGLACTTAASRNQPWNESMRKMSAILTNLVPDLTRPEIFTTSDERAEVLARSKRLLGLVHIVNQSENTPTHDPAVKIVSGDLKRELNDSIQLMQLGRWSQGSRQMLDIARYCIACHTMSPGPASVEIQADLNGLSPVRRAHFYAANRQFDLAVINYEKALTDTKWALQNESEWNDAFQKLLAITVRARNSPGLTLELISRFFDANTYPSELKGVARTWRSHAKEWREEVRQSEVGRNSYEVKKIETLLKRAESLGAGKSEFAGFVLYLRASSVLHLQMRQPEHIRNQKLLLLAGRAAEGLRAQNFWTFPEHYYRECIAVNANSSLGRNCAIRLKDLEER